MVRFLPLLLLLSAVAIPTTSLRAQSHFTTCVSGTGENATLIIPTSSTPTISGQAIQSGDEIAVFTPEGLCAGVAVWDGANLPVTVWGDDTQTDSKDGFDDGDALGLAIWDEDTDTEYGRSFGSVDVTYDASETYYATDGLYGTDKIYVLSALRAVPPAPAAPLLSTPADGAAGISLTPTLSWQDVTGADDYDVQVSTDADFSTTVVDVTGHGTTSFAFAASLASGTAHYWRVRASNTGGPSDWTTFSFTTRPSAPIPVTPADEAGDVSRTPTLSWQDVTGADDYDVQVSTDAGFSTTVVDVTGHGTTSFAVSSVLAPSTAYYWRVRATSAGAAGDFSTTFSFTTVPAVPDAPVLSTPADGATGTSLTPTLSWQAAAGADDYDVELSAASDFSTTIVDVTGHDPTSFTISATLDANTTYYWRVRAANAGGAGAYAEAFSFTTIPQQQQIGLEAGWNMVSSFITPDQPAVADLFSPIVDQTVLVKDVNGDMYAPGFGINTIGDWEADQAFMVFVDSEAAPQPLTFVGTPILPESRSITLSAGWNWMAYWRVSSLDIASALAVLSDDLVLVKDVRGNLYFPDEAITDLDRLQPGMGYKIYVHNEVTFHYPTNSAGKTSPAASKVSSTRSALASSATLVLEVGAALEGHILSVWAGERVVGRATVEDGRAVITVVGLDPLQPDVVQGAQVGQRLQVRRGLDLDAPALEITSLRDALRRRTVTELRYVQDGVWIGLLDAAVAVDEETIPLAFTLEANFPNPFNPSTTIAYALPRATHVRLEVTNVLGQRVAVLVDDRQTAGRHEVSFVADGLPSGVYLYRLQAGDFSEVRRMMLAK